MNFAELPEVVLDRLLPHLGLGIREQQERKMRRQQQREQEGADGKTG